ncbi:MAG TPA: hypothetical protein VFQ51_01455 [Vicinamibacteria bacterium]|nr:hypothetical protein [Vicinamibacteria bacterium]
MFSKASVEELRALLVAYRTVRNGSWPQLHAAMDARANRWPTLGEGQLAAELEEYLRESDAPDTAVRVFWKVGPRFVFAGCNDRFARDAGLASAVLMGLDDFDARLPWGGQASKYRTDDMEVYKAGVPKLDILERQKSPTGEVFWVRVGKAPIMLGGAAHGVLGMYDILDDKTASKIFFARSSGS